MPLRMSPGALPSTGIRITSRSVPFAMASTRMPNQIANAFAAIPADNVLSCSLTFEHSRRRQAGAPFTYANK